MTSDRAKALGLAPLARVHTAVVTGDDPVKMLTGPDSRDRTGPAALGARDRRDRCLRGQRSVRPGAPWRGRSRPARRWTGSIPSAARSRWDIRSAPLVHVSPPLWCITFGAPEAATASRRCARERARRTRRSTSASDRRRSGLVRGSRCSATHTAIWARDVNPSLPRMCSTCPSAVRARDHELGGDVLVAQAVGDQVGDLALPAGENADGTGLVPLRRRLRLVQCERDVVRVWPLEAHSIVRPRTPARPAPAVVCCSVSAR